jgi:hypothetical protein
VLNFLNSGSANTLFNLTGTGDFDLQANGTSMLFGSSSGKIGIGTTSPSEMLTVLGDVSFNYTGAGNGLYGSGSCPYALGYFTNSYPGSTWGLSAGCSSASASSSSYGVMGFNSGSGYGLYGRSSNGYGAYGENITATNFGYLGGATYGVYGSCEGNSGYIGGSTNAIVGNHSNGNNGYLGGTDYGAFGYLATSGNGDYAVHGYGPHALSVDGTSYANINTLGGVKGLCYYGNPYTFGTAGYSYLDYFRSGGAFGSNYQGTLWGCMAY